MTKHVTHIIFSACMLLTPTVGWAQAETDDSPTDQPQLKRLPNGNVQLGQVRLNRDEKTISFPAKIELRKGPLEVLIAAPHGRLHETLLTADVNALHLQVMLYLIGLENGARLPGGEVAHGDLVDIDLLWNDMDGNPHRRPVEFFLHDRRLNDVAARTGWVFVGSSAQAGELLAEIEGNLALTWSNGQTILDTPDPEGHDDTLFTAHTEHLKAIPENAEVTVILIPRE